MSQKLYKIRINKGDTVIVLAGKDKGKTGKVISTLPFENKVIVDGVNIVKKHRKPTRSNPQGSIEEITKPIWVSKVAVFDPTTKKPTRIGYSTDKAGNKIRISKNSGKELTTQTTKGKGK